MHTYKSVAIAEPTGEEPPPGEVYVWSWPLGWHTVRALIRDLLAGRSGSASVATLRRRVAYGGRKGRRAALRLRARGLA